MKHKTAELEGALLDAAVAMAEGAKRSTGLRTPFPHWAFPGGATILISAYRPSDEWWRGGPIIERELFEISRFTGGNQAWMACWRDERGSLMGHAGPTPLIAAMRAFVASKLGEEVEL